MMNFNGPADQISLLQNPAKQNRGFTQLEVDVAASKDNAMSWRLKSLLQLICNGIC
jgi:hypothetical protein